MLADTGGAYLEPTVVTGAGPDNVLVREELFGPVLTVQVIGDESEALRVAQDTPYGLAAAVWTDNLGAAYRISRALKAGTVWVNCYEEGDKRAVRRRQAVRVGARQVPSCDGRVHRPQDHLDQLWMRGGPRRFRPIVVIPARFSASASVLRSRAEVTAARLVESVWAAGGEPLTVHPDAPGAVLDDALVDAVAKRFSMADAILLPGGGDMSARWSGQQVHDTLYDVDEEQDAFDLALGRWALRDGIPLLAICRGNQVVNVARGGDLVQDMTEATGRDHRHLVHDIELDAESPLRKVVDGDRLTISCYHHQCLGVLGRGLRPAAHASDRTVEAVTIDGHEGWYLGVQWHPEDSADTDPVQASIFRAFVDAAR